MTQGEVPERGPYFPISAETARQTIDFFNTEDPLSKHREVAMDMGRDNFTFIESLGQFADAWEMRGVQETSFTGGVTVTYKLLQTEAESYMAKLPEVSMTTINTFIEDINQSGGDSFMPYLERRDAELVEEDPTFNQFVATYTKARLEALGEDEAFFFLWGCKLTYDIFRKQIAADELKQQFDS